MEKVPKRVYTKRYALMKKLTGGFTVELMTRMFKGSCSGYYAWLNRAPSKRVQGGYQRPM
jgi:hypothetical protein